MKPRCEGNTRYQVPTPRPERGRCRSQATETISWRGRAYALCGFHAERTIQAKRMLLELIEPSIVSREEADSLVAYAIMESKIFAAEADTIAAENEVFSELAAILSHGETPHDGRAIVEGDPIGGTPREAT